MGCISEQPQRPQVSQPGQHQPSLNPYQNQPKNRIPNPPGLQEIKTIKPSTKPILRPIFPKNLIHPLSNNLMINEIRLLPNQFIQVKVPKDFTKWTQFIWFKEPLYYLSTKIEKLQPKDIKIRSFQQKMAWFRIHLQKLRISYLAEKSDYLKVDRQNLIMSSHSQFEKINFYKQVKIIFEGQQQNNDAGGLIRQWINLCIKEIFNQELNMFKMCDTTQTFYKFNFNQQSIDQNVRNLFQVAAKILGIVIGKALFQRIPLNCRLNYTILRQLCGHNIQINDIFSYDKDLYRGWQMYLNQNGGISSFQTNFCVYEIDQHGVQNTIPLKENGFDIMVTSQNRDEYIELLINHYCVKSVKVLLDHLKYGLYKIVPPHLLSIFQPYQLDMMINGKSSINVLDLKANTIYTGFTPKDVVILWFWGYIQKLSQEKLSNFIHFVTGNGRVPIFGFKYLESNRGQYQKFHIKQVPYNPTDPYPKSHTCFNRLQLPRYPTYEQFEKYIQYCTIQMIHFGLKE